MFPLAPAVSAGYIFMVISNYIKQAMENYNMPIYEYRCPQCGEKFEKIVTAAAAKVNCEKCHVPAARQLSVFAAPATSSASACKFNQDCPSAGGHTCGCGCGCHSH